MSNPIIDELALYQAGVAMNFWPALRNSPRAPQLKAHIQAAIIKAITAALEHASGPVTSVILQCPQATEGSVDHVIALCGPLGWFYVHCSCGWNGPVCNTATEAIKEWNSGKGLKS